MILALDVAYQGQIATVGWVEFKTWTAEAADCCGTLRTQAASAYVPGEFYKRELPCLLEALKERNREYRYILIDGYVHLAGAGCRGLGQHLYEAVQGRSGVVGIAKSRLKIAAGCIPVYRGRSLKPLFVSAAGMHPSEAADRVRLMSGKYRIPDMVKLADRLTKGPLKPS